MTRIMIAALMGLLMLTNLPVNAETVNFEDLTLEPESYYNGSDGAGEFSSGGTAFNNYYSESEFDGYIFIYWEGFAYSNTTDSITEGYTNQYSAYPGGGAGGSAVYGVGYQPGYYGNGTVPTITFPEEVRIVQASIANTTYAYLTMKDGYFTAEKFGGDAGDEPDWFLLTITGIDADGKITDAVEFFLADYRFEDDSLDFIAGDWTTVDLSRLGKVKSVEFALTSSDTNPDPTIGINTPTYFAIDNIIYSFTDVDDDVDGFTENQGDCNDDDAGVYPAAEEICGDGIDQDCDGSDAVCPKKNDDNSPNDLGCFINSVR